MISGIRAFLKGNFGAKGHAGAKTGDRRRGGVVTRFAPSPTGLLHAGNYRTGVFAYLYARQNKGKFILRIEDTDTARSKKEYEDNIVDSLKWLGLEYDEMYRQSERGGLYRQYLEKLIAEGKVYVSSAEEETARAAKGENPGPRKSAIRFKNPNKKVRFDDLIRGEIEFDTTDLGDFVIAKSVTEPIFHFAVVLDDFLMGVTHVIRGEDHISNTPRQILVMEALGAPIPTYAHLPLVLAHDRSKLSKRHGAKAITHYRDIGFMRDALLNYMALLGWNPGTEQEIFDRAGLIKTFDLSKVQKGGAIFNEEKLRWVNKEHLKRVDPALLASDIRSRILSSERARDLKWNLTDEGAQRLAPVLLERVSTFGDIDALITAQDLDYYFAEPAYDALSLKWKEDVDLAPAARHLDYAKAALAGIPDKRWDEEGIKAAIWPYAEAEGRGNVLWPLRYALSGKDRSPNPFTLAAILGKVATIQRIEQALRLIKTTADAKTQLP
ncbi:MAG TPA: glutamate--tRNA ligase family protein [Candidatus Paceibacterota bacterium]|nr:glutamate--tRNA ligase family protein [Candidatus Paceibacterota bacterium]